GPPSGPAPGAVAIGRAPMPEPARLPLGPVAATRDGAPYWMIHRGDLQAALLGAALAHPDIRLDLGTEVDGCAAHADGVAVRVLHADAFEEVHAAALVGADGLWSRVRTLAGETETARFADRAAWRALVPADAVTPAIRAPTIHLWLGHGSHLVHYPVKAGAMINIVAIAGDARPSE